jgi:hypothetical protein
VRTRGGAGRHRHHPSNPCSRPVSSNGLAKQKISLRRSWQRLLDLVMMGIARHFSFSFLDVRSQAMGDAEEPVFMHITLRVKYQLSNNFSATWDPYCDERLSNLACPAPPPCAKHRAGHGLGCPVSLLNKTDTRNRWGVEFQP